MWPIVTMNEDEKNYMMQWLENLSPAYEAKSVYIWGAGVRGAHLGYFLEQRGFFNFAYLDNDPDKQGDTLEGHIIYGSDQLGNITDGYILVSLENSDEIIPVLGAAGFRQGEQYAVLENVADEIFVHDLMSVKPGDRVLLGGSDAKHVELGGTCPVAELVHAKGYPVLALDCIPAPLIYFTAKYLCKLGKVPQRLVVLVNPELLNNVNHLLPRTQKRELIRRLLDECPDEELAEYARAQKVEDYELEKQYAPKRGTSDETQIEAGRREYLQNQILAEVDYDNVSCKFLTKLVELSKEKKIDLQLVWEPYNYQAVRECAGDAALECLAHKWQELQMQLGCQGVDLSYLFPDDGFVKYNTHDDCLRRPAREEMARRIIALLAA